MLSKCSSAIIRKKDPWVISTVFSTEPKQPSCSEKKLTLSQPKPCQPPVLVDSRVHLAGHKVLKAPSQQGLAAVLLMGSRPPNPGFVLQAGLPSSPGAGTGSVCAVLCCKELLQGQDAVVCSPATGGRALGGGCKCPVDGTVSPLVCPARGEGDSPVPGWKSLPFAGQRSHWLYSDRHLYLTVFLPDPPAGISSSEFAAVLLSPVEVVGYIWTTWSKKSKDKPERWRVCKFCWL